MALRNCAVPFCTSGAQPGVANTKFSRSVLHRHMERRYINQRSETVVISAAASPDSLRAASKATVNPYPNTPYPDVKSFTAGVGGERSTDSAQVVGELKQTLSIPELSADTVQGPQVDLDSLPPFAKDIWEYLTVYVPQDWQKTQNTLNEAGSSVFDGTRTSLAQFGLDVSSLESFKASFASLVTTHPWQLAAALAGAAVLANRALAAAEVREKEAQEIALKIEDARQRNKNLERQQSARIKRREIRGSLKADLFQRVAELGAAALREGFGEDRDQIARVVRRLELLPVEAKGGALAGEWELIYASRGTTLTRPITLPGAADSGGAPQDGAGASGSASTSMQVDNMTQHLEEGEGGEEMHVSNAADMDMGPLGKWRISASGGWEGGSSAGEASSVSFREIELLPVDAGLVRGGALAGLQLPPLKLPLPDLLRQKADWKTTWLDEDMRIARGDKNGIFIFRRSGAGSGDSAAGAAADGLEAMPASAGPLMWTPEAKAELDKAPFFVKDAAKKKAEEYALSVGATQVDMDVVVASR